MSAPNSFDDDRICRTKPQGLLEISDGFAGRSISCAPDSPSQEDSWILASTYTAGSIGSSEGQKPRDSAAR